MLNWFDILILVVLLIAFIKGYQNGLIRMLIGLATVILAAVFGGKLASLILPEAEKILNLYPQWAKIFAYTISFLTIAAVLSLVGAFLQKLFEAVNLNFLNRILGSLVAIGTYMVLLSILLNLFLLVDRKEKIIDPDLKKKSFFFNRVQVVVPTIVPYLNNDILNDLIPEEFKSQYEILQNELNNPSNVQTIDSTYQKKYFETDTQ